MTGPSNPTKAKLIQLGFNAFNQEGFKPVTMDKLAKELRISKKTIYKYFESKEALLEESLRRHLDENEAQLKDAIKKNPVTEGFYIIFRHFQAYLALLSPALIKELKEIFPHLNDWLQLHEKQVFKKQFSKVAKELRGAGQIEYPTTTRELSAGFFAMLRGIATMSEEDAIPILKIFVRGLKAKKSKKDKKNKKKV